MQTKLQHAFAPGVRTAASPSCRRTVISRAPPSRRRTVVASAAAAGAPRAAVPLSAVYALLGLQVNAPYPEVRAAYRRAAAATHPDVNPENPSAANKFKAINLALEVLSDEALRRACGAGGVAGLGPRFSFLREYLIGHAPPRVGGSTFTSSGPARGDGYDGGPATGQASSSYDYARRTYAAAAAEAAQAAGSKGPRAGVTRERGGDVYTVAGVEFEQAVTGVERTLSLRSWGACPDCGGAGCEAQSKVPLCPICGGTGSVMRREWSPNGAPAPTALGTCPACHGAGRGAARHCTRCQGEGRTRVLRNVKVRVPAGVTDGQVLRIKGQGDAGTLGGEPGDLFVKLQVYELRGGMERVGDDLFSQLEVSLFDALLGADMAVATVRGERMLTVPPGTQHGAQIVMENAGVVASTRGGVTYGHHIFTVAIRVPSAERADPATRRLLQRLAKSKGREWDAGPVGDGEGEAPRWPYRAPTAAMPPRQQQATPPPPPPPQTQAAAAAEWSSEQREEQNQQQEEEEEQQQQQQQQEKPRAAAAAAEDEEQQAQAAAESNGHAPEAASVQHNPTPSAAAPQAAAEAAEPAAVPPPTPAAAATPSSPPPPQQQQQQKSSGPAAWPRQAWNAKAFNKVPMQPTPEPAAATEQAPAQPTAQPAAQPAAQSAAQAEQPSPQATAQQAAQPAAQQAAQPAAKAAAQQAAQPAAQQAAQPAAQQAAQPTAQPTAQQAAQPATQQAAKAATLPVAGQQPVQDDERWMAKHMWPQYAPIRNGKQQPTPPPQQQQQERQQQEEEEQQQQQEEEQEEEAAKAPEPQPAVRSRTPRAGYFWRRVPSE